MIITENKTQPVDVEFTDKEPPLLHIVQLDGQGRAPDKALCGAKVSDLHKGGSASCKRCVEIRLGMTTDKGWAKL